MDELDELASLNSELESLSQARKVCKDMIQEKKYELRRFEITIEVKEEEIRRILQNNEDMLDKVQYLQEDIIDPVENKRRRKELEEANSKLDIENKMMLGQVNVLGQRIVGVENKISEESKFNDHEHLQRETACRMDQLRLLKEEINQLSNEKALVDKNNHFFTEGIHLLRSDIKNSQDNIDNLQSIKDALGLKLEKNEDLLKAVASKLEFHDQEEKRLASEVYFHKKLLEEAVLSFQKFEFKLVGFINQNASAIIFRSDKGMQISLVFGKKRVYLNQESGCVIFMNPKKKNRFFICLDDKTREFESEDAEKITNIINLAMQTNLEQ